MNPKIEKLNRDIEKTETKILELQEKVKEMKKQRTDLENADFVSTCRNYHLTPGELDEFLKSRKLPDVQEEAEGTNED